MVAAPAQVLGAAVVSGGELVERWTHEPDGWPAVLLGAPDPRALIDLAQPGAMTHALDALGGLYPLVVCDVGFPIEDARSAHLHREALIAADSIIVVLGAREPQLHAGLRQLDIILTELGIRSERLRIVVNAVGGPSRRDKGTITATIAEHLAERDLTVDAWLPWDARGLRRSEQHGKPIALTRRRSAFTRVLTGLLDELFLPSTSPRAKRRKRRLAAPPGNTPSAEREEVVWQR
jgi:Flp pilus assembly CpaE family ATPase